MQRAARRQARGFSLMEVMIVVVIVAVIAAIAMPNFLTMVQNTRISTTADSVRDAVMVARTEAIRRGTPVTLSGTGTPPWSTGWELRDAGNTSLREGQFASGVTVDLVNAPAGANNIVFRPNGTLNNTPTSEMYVRVQGAAGSTARAVRLNRGVSVCKSGDSNCPI
jgi:type IV fimbrial biogenesis protein FimT